MNKLILGGVWVVEDCVGWCYDWISLYWLHLSAYYIIWEYHPLYFIKLSPFLSSPLPFLLPFLSPTLLPFFSLPLLPFPPLQLGSYCLSEPHCGGDAFALKTSAKKDSEHWILNGQKAWITNAEHAGFFIVMANIDFTKVKKGRREGGKR